MIYLCIVCRRRIPNSSTLPNQRRQLNSVIYSAKHPQWKRVSALPSKATSSDRVICPRCENPLFELKIRFLPRRNNLENCNSIPMAYSLQCRTAMYKVFLPHVDSNFRTFLAGVKEPVIGCMKKDILRHKKIKVQMKLLVRYKSQTSSETAIKSFATLNQVVCQEDELAMSLVYKYFVDNLCLEGSKFGDQNSGWSVMDILYAELDCYKYIPLKLPPTTKKLPT